MLSEEINKEKIFFKISKIIELIHGKYQIILLIILCLLNYLIGNYFFSIFYFVTYPKYKCCKDINCFETFDCSKKLACSSNNYRAYFDYINYSSTNNLVCEKEIYINLFYSMLILFGSFLNFIIVLISDYIGRKKIILLSLIIIMILLTINIIFFDIFIIILISNCIIYGIVDGLLIVLIIFFVESTNKKFQNFGCNIIAIFSSLAGIFVNNIIPQDLRYFIIFLIILVIILFLLIFFFTEESLFYLQNKNFTKKFKITLLKLIKFNKKYKEKQEIMDMINHENQKEILINNDKKYNLKLKWSILFKKKI